MFELIELFRRLKSYRAQRCRENLSQSQLLKKELRLIGLALVVVVAFIGFFALLAFVL